MSGDVRIKSGDVRIRSRLCILNICVGVASSGVEVARTSVDDDNLVDAAGASRDEANTVSMFVAMLVPQCLLPSHVFTLHALYTSLHSM